MTPLYFGNPQRRLFGIYSPASVGARRPRAVVLCPPWGQEYLRAHRSMRQLALRLTAAGIHVLRFDYYGTGDSAGDMSEGDLAGWESDIESAIEELIDTTGVQRVGLIGLRFGATLAARAAVRRRKEVESLVLWDPVVAGEEFIDQLLALDAASSGLPAPRQRPFGRPGWQLLGFAVTPALRDELASTDLLSLVPSLPGRCLLITSDSSASQIALRERLAARGDSASAFEQVASEPAWLEQRNSGAGAVPVALLERIVSWYG
jgi:uncharacterized protein